MKNIIERLKTLAQLLTISLLFFSQTSFLQAQVSGMEDTSMTEPVMESQTDTTGPVFISIGSTSTDQTEATIAWSTDEPAYGYVEYGPSLSYGQKTSQTASLEMSQSQILTNLEPGTRYNYRVVAQDASGNISYSQNQVLETSVAVVAMDNAPPEITQVTVSGITTKSATLSWQTDELASGYVEYGRTSTYGFSSANSSDSADYATDHLVKLSGLKSDTRYHYRIVVQDESGNQSVTPDETFVTAAEPAAAAPSETDNATDTQIELKISLVETSNLSKSSVTITWATNEPANSQVFYGTTDNYGQSSSLHSDLTQSHEILINGLTPGTNYFYKVVSKADGRTATQDGLEFTTLYEPVVTDQAPTISNVATQSVKTDSATIVWTTDEPTRGQIYYGLTTEYDYVTDLSSSLDTNHSQTIQHLTGDTTYNFQIIARDSAGNETIYQNLTFKTLPEPENVLSTGASIVGKKTNLVKKLGALPRHIVLQNLWKSKKTISPAKLKPNPATDNNLEQVDLKLAKVFPAKFVAKPVVIKAQALSDQALFIWAASTQETGVKTVIVRSAQRYASAPTPQQGSIIYYGNSGTFTDINLEVGKVYYYSIFKISGVNSYSKPVNFKIVPTVNVTQTKFVAVPPIVQKAPIFTFEKSLRFGDNSEAVGNLQTVLASMPKIYPRGLVTGYFGPLTLQAVKSFQSLYKLEITGIADGKTLNKLEAFVRVK